MASTNPTPSSTLGIRSASRDSGLSRDTIREKVLPEIPHRWITPRRVVFLRVDFEGWIRGQSIKPTAHAEDVIAARVERESRAQNGEADPHANGKGRLRGDERAKATQRAEAART